MYTDKKSGVQVLRDKYSLDELIELEATRRGIDPKLIRGIVRTESSERPEAISPVGARGLMQLMPSTARGMGFTGTDEELHDPSINVALGVSYFKELLDRYNGDVTKALSAYNQGPGNLAKHGVEGETGNPGKYVEKVKEQSFKDGGKVGVFDRPVSPMRMKPGMDEADIEMIIERALSKVLGGENYASGGIVYDPTQDQAKKKQAQQKQASLPKMKAANSGGGSNTLAQQSWAAYQRGEKNLPAGMSQQQFMQKYFPKAVGGAGSQNPGGGGGGAASSGSLMGQVTQTANQLENFNPLSSQQENRLNSIAQTGLKTDVAPITQANIQQGRDEFNNLIAPSMNEQFGALGLGSSTARLQGLQREAGRISTNIGAEGLRQGVQAEENAANRSLSAFNPILGASGQELQGLGQAGGLQLGQAGLVSNERLAEKGLASQTQLQQAQLNQQAALQNQQLAFQKAQLEAQMAMQAAMVGGGSSNVSYGGSGTVYGGTGGGGFAARGGAVKGGRITDKGVVGGLDYAKGGRVDEHDFLSNYLYGRQFNERSGNITMPKFEKFDIKIPEFKLRSSGSSSGDGYRGPSINERNQQVRDDAREHQQALELARLPYEYQQRAQRRNERMNSYAAQKMAEALQAGPRSYLGDAGGRMSLANMIAAIGVDRAHEGLAQVGRLMAAQGVGVPMSTGSMRARGTMISSQPQNKREGGQVDDGWDYMPMDEFDDGGLVEGRKYPVDRVRINAQGGEGIIPLEMMERLENYQSDDPMIKEIQKLMDFDNGERNFAEGGIISDVAAFLQKDAQRRTDRGGTALEDRELEGALMASLLGPLAPLATVPVIAAGGAYEGVKGLAQATGTGKYLPGPFKVDETTSPASLENVIALAKGFTEKATGKAKGGKVEKYHGGGKTSCPPGQHLMPNHTCMDNDNPSMKKGKKNYQTGGQLPTDRQMNLSKGAPGYTFSNKDLATYQTPTSEGVSFNAPPVDFDYEIQQRAARRASEDRRISLYESLGMTAGPAVRAKLAALAQQAMANRDKEDEGIAQLMQLKGQQELAKGQQDIVKQQAADLSAYREGQLGLGQARLENSALANQIKALEKATGMSITDFIALAQQKTETQEQ